jgi:hypothetical protein
MQKGERGDRCETWRDKVRKPKGIIEKGISEKQKLKIQFQTCLEESFSDDLFRQTKPSIA